MLVEVFSDTVCPWCYVGKRRLEEAIAARPEIPIEVRWLPFELNPDMPEGGADRATYLRARFGDAGRFAGVHRTLQALGADLGIGFRFDRIARMPNTRRSHALIAWAGSLPDGARAQSGVKGRVLRAYFSEGRDIGDPEVLVAIAGEAGLDSAAARAALDSPAWHREITTLEERARSWGISGVPAFVFERRHLIPGAQESGVFLQLIDRLAAARMAAP